MLFSDEPGFRCLMMEPMRSTAMMKMYSIDVMLENKMYRRQQG